MSETDSSPERDWTCAAYGELPGKLRGTCFLAGAEQDSAVVCPDLGSCQSHMEDERRRIYRRMQELSTHDPLFADLAREFPTPETLLGGSQTR